MKFSVIIIWKIFTKLVNQNELASNNKEFAENLDDINDETDYFTDFDKFYFYKYLIFNFLTNFLIIKEFQKRKPTVPITNMFKSFGNKKSARN